MYNACYMYQYTVDMIYHSRKPHPYKVQTNHSSNPYHNPIFCKDFPWKQFYWCPFIIVKFHYCENSPFAGKRMGRHINVKLHYQTAFISIKNVCGQKLLAYCIAKHHIFKPINDMH